MGGARAAEPAATRPHVVRAVRPMLPRRPRAVVRRSARAAAVRTRNVTCMALNDGTDAAQVHPLGLCQRRLAV